ncbi:Lectin-B [Ceratocystis platani]|uniref:chitinase n=1 Tax=Ceratocystis fimbriata f. sp. platani TaxID=88771 RepID=A0A0F8CN71_CERFI|nr:Lectin-B [Ceratocystis platani]
MVRLSALASALAMWATTAAAAAASGTAPGLGAYNALSTGAYKAISTGAYKAVSTGSSSPYSTTATTDSSDPARYIMYFDQWHTSVLPNKTMTAGITHIVMAFAEPLVFTTNPIGEYKPHMELDKVREMFDENVKISMAVGGWGFLVGFREGARSPESRALYAKNIAATVENFGYDGVDIDWEYPGGNGEDYKQVPNDPSEIEAYPLLLAEIKKAIGDKELSIAVPGLERDMMAYTPEKVAAINAVVDYVNVMTYDLINRRDTVSGHHSGVKNSLAAIDAYIERGFPASKLNLGIGFYAKYFTLQDPKSCTQAIGCPLVLAERDDGTDAGTSGVLTFEASSFPVFVDRSKLTLSPDTSCGGSTGYTCGDKSCCSKWGWCGVTPGHCATGCQSDFGHCGDFPESNEVSDKATVENVSGTKETPKTSQLSLSPDTSCGGETGYTCGESSCCSKWGWCGVTPGHCGAGCQTGFGLCDSDAPKEAPKEAEAPKTAELTPSPNGSCGGKTGYTCTNSNCCSKWGWCGGTSEYCGAGCQTGFGLCDSDAPKEAPKEVEAPKTAELALSPDGSCGGKTGYTCTGSNCCSKWGWCGGTSEYCGAGCQTGFGRCDSDATSSSKSSDAPKEVEAPKTAELAPSPDGSCGGKTGYTCTGSNCCSKWGWCGATSQYCGAGCQTGFGRCDSTDAQSPAKSFRAIKRDDTTNTPDAPKTTETSDAPKATETPDAPKTSKLTLSPDGTCGGETGYTCTGTNCCSKWGWCGATDDFCGAGCQAGFGRCDPVSDEKDNKAPKVVLSPDGSCGGENGYTCTGTNCCSKWGWCGATDDFCGAGCQPGFGRCDSTDAQAQSPAKSFRVIKRQETTNTPDAPKATETSDAPKATETPDAPKTSKLTLSPDGTCGGETGYTCTGTNCCSKWGWCGATDDFCGAGCQAGFGRCDPVSDEKDDKTPKVRGQLLFEVGMVWCYR